jgi:hypothetical protein
VIALAWLLARRQSVRRLLLVASCSAVASALLLLCVALLRLPSEPAEGLFSLVADTGTRGGVVLALALLVAPVLLLVHQAVRLGSGARQHRLAVLRTAGATVTQVRWLGALELGVPAALGAAGGGGLYLLLRLVFGGATDPNPPPVVVGGLVVRTPGLVPVSVAPSWWQFLAVVVGVSAVVTLVGWRVTRAVVHAPLEQARLHPASAPRPWGLLLVVAGAVLYALTSAADVQDALAPLAAVALAAVGLMLIGPWVAAQAGRRAAERATTVAQLLAGRRLVADPRSAGRAAAPVGAVGLVAGGAGLVVGLLVVEGLLELFYVASVLLVVVVLLAALTLVACALAVHGVESLTDHRRSMAALAAAGVPVEELERSLRVESEAVAQPVATAGVLVGSVALLGLALAEGFGPAAAAVGLVVTLVTLLVTRLLVRLATVVAVRLVRPWLRACLDPEVLRTE